MSFKKLLCLLIIAILINNCDSNKEKTKETIDTELESMIGQMIMAGFRGLEIEKVNPKFLEQIEKGYLGGVVFFDYDVRLKSTERNIRSPEQVKKLIGRLQNHAKIPLFVAVDQEGGKVNRLKSKYGFPASVSAKYLGTLDNLDSTKHYALLNAKTLKELGFNVNFSPDVDVDLNPDNPVIGKYERSYSNNYEIVIKHASAWVAAHDSIGIISTLKHFPGHGSASSDSHLGVTDITDYWREEELLPFKAILQGNYIVAVMTAHVINNKLDSVYPATLSKKVITNILREDLSFSGIVFSDDLQMKAVNAMYDFNTILKRSIEAGIDILVFGNNLEFDEQAPEKAVKAIYEMVQNGTISRDRIKRSYDRIMRYKRTF